MSKAEEYSKIIETVQTYHRMGITVQENRYAYSKL